VGGQKLRLASAKAAEGGLRLLALAATGVLLVSCAHGGQTPDGPNVIGDPLGTLLASSTDLGPAHGHPVQVTVALRDPTHPRALMGWAASHHLSVRWRPGDDYAYVAGPPGDMSSAFGVAVHDYRSLDGLVFYASARQPDIPAPVRGEVAELGRILSYKATHLLKPPMVPLDVPNRMLSPSELLTAYDATPLGVTGKGRKVVFFEVDGFNQAELDKFSATYHLPPFTPTEPQGPKARLPGNDETPMDLQDVHAIAPDAQLVIYYMPNNEGPHSYAAAATVFEQADHDYPGAVWSLSFGLGCDAKGWDTAADLKPVRDAFAAAEAHGTSIFVSSGDSGGYECKGFSQLYGKKANSFTPPSNGDIGLNSLASVPEATDTGGTTLSTDAHGVWAAEEGWADYPGSMGTGGGVSFLFARPDWQRGVSVPPDPVFAERSIPDPATHRLTPDVSADADPGSGVAMFECDPCDNAKPAAGGGTSQAAPIWAGLTTLMDQYLLEHGGHPIGAMNPVLYPVAASGARPAFHHPTLGGNAVFDCGAGFNLATGLGTPDTANLVNDILDTQKAGG
jgi:kumamolisin